MRSTGVQRNGCPAVPAYARRPSAKIAASVRHLSPRFENMGASDGHLR
jgi:hypothetical protein